MHDTTITKSGGKQQPYNQVKLEKSLKTSCLAVESTIGEAEKYADLISQTISKWLKTKSEVTSEDLRVKSGQELKKYHPNAAYFYTNYKKTI